MRLFIVDEPEQMSESLRPLFAEGEDSNATAQSGIFARMTLPRVIGARLVRTPSRRTAPDTATNPKLPDFADLQLENSPELMAALLNTIGLAYLTKGRLHEAECFIQQALDMRLKLYGSEHPQTALSINSLARVLRDDGRLDEALQRINEALRIDTRTAGGSSLAAAGDLAVLASIQFERSELTEAEHAARSAVNIFDEKVGGSDPWVPYLLDLIARIHQWRSNYTKAAEVYQRVQQIDLKLYGKDHPIYAVRLHNYAIVLAAQGKLPEAKKIYDDVIAILREASGEWHPNLIDLLTNRGTLLTTLRAFAEAREDLEEAAQRNLKVRGADHPYIGYDHLCIGKLDYEEDKLGPALEHFEQALAIFRDKLSDEHAYTAAALTWKGRTLLELQRAADAEPVFKEATKVWRAELGERSVEHAIANAGLARAWFLQGKEDASVPDMLRTALAIVKGVRGADDPTAQLIRDWLKEADPSESC